MLTIPDGWEEKSLYPYNQTENPRFLKTFPADPDQVQSLGYIKWQMNEL